MQATVFVVRVVLFTLVAAFAIVLLPLMLVMGAGVALVVLL